MCNHWVTLRLGIDPPLGISFMQRKDYLYHRPTQPMPVLQLSSLTLSFSSLYMCSTPGHIFIAIDFICVMCMHKDPPEMPI